MLQLISSTSPIQLVTTAIFGYWILWIFYARFFHPLRSVPGPFLASISRAWIVYKTGRGDMEYTQRALHKKYGYLVRIAPNEISCSDPNAIKTDFYDAWQAKINKGYAGHFQTRDEKAHTERRRIVNNVYSIASVLESEDAINSCTAILCDTMKESAKQKSRIDLSLWMNMYAFDVLGELFFGNDFGFMKGQKAVGNYMKAIHSICIKNTMAGTLPSYLSGLTFLNPAVVHYDTDWFGPDAEQYNPDRWLGEDAQHMEKAMLHFGIGTRICIGKNIALSEIYKLIPQLVREFHIRPAEPTKKLESCNYWFNKVVNEHVYFETRQSIA